MPENNVIQNPVEDEQQKMMDFTDARIHLHRIVNDWNDEIEDTEVRRKTRKFEVNTELLRQKNELDEDETIVPIRVINSNITREQPPYINYIKNSRRIALFESQDNSDTDLLEQAFTKVASYSGWEKPIYKCLDGSQAHGWDAVEVIFDESKPGHFALEHIGHDKLLFPRSAIDLQHCPRIVRSYDVTMLQLRQWVKKFGFDQTQVDLILQPKKNTQKENETEKIYKLYFKVQDPITAKNIVYISWFSLASGVTDWLKNPVKFNCGVKGRDMELYPIFILPYQITEEQKITDHRGRCFLDEPKQESQTALWSAYINGNNRACQIFASPSQDDGTGVSLKEYEELRLTGGRILNKPMTFWSPPYPDAQILKLLQYADVQNSQETNQVDFAAINREDSRKTAKEIGAAQQQQALLNSVQLTLFSTFIRDVYSFAWLIVQSQALQSLIVFLPIQVQQPMMNPLTNMPMMDQMGQPMMQNVIQNDFETIGKPYIIRAAGDVDVVQKQELEQKFQQDWPVIQTTALKDVFLMDYIKLRYPDKADRYATILQQNSQMEAHKMLIGKLSTTLQGLIQDSPEEISQLSQQEKSDLASMLQEAGTVVNQPTPY